LILPDVNVLLYAHRADAEHHAFFRDWVTDALEGDEPVGLADIVLAGFMRIASHPRIYQPPTPLGDAIEAASALRSAPGAVRIMPGARHWEIFTRLCAEANATGNLASDAYLAALAVESGCELVSTDRDFARFPRLRWRNPLDQ
jgi:toxin-antitoxin system PIN domain toxin